MTKTNNIDKNTGFCPFLTITPETVEATEKEDYHEREIRNIRKLITVYAKIVFISCEATIKQKLLSARKMQDLTESLYISALIDDPEKEIMDINMDIFYNHILSLSEKEVPTTDRLIAAKDYEAFLNIQ